MKNVIFMLLFFCCSLKTEKNISEDIVLLKSHVSIEKVVLHHVPLVGIFTIVDIPCEEVESTFGTDLRKDTITNPDEIVLLKTYMDSLNVIIDPQTIKLGMDARAKIYFISPVDTTEYCIDSGLVYSEGVYYRISKELFDYLNSLDND